MKLTWCFLVVAVFVLLCLHDGEAGKKRRGSRNKGSNGEVDNQRRGGRNSNRNKADRQAARNARKDRKKAAKEERKAARQMAKLLRKQEGKDRKKARNNLVDSRRMLRTGGRRVWRDKKVMKLECQTPKKVTVVSATYVIDGQSTDVKAKLSPLCDNKYECALRVSADSLGVTASGKKARGELEVDYNCDEPEFILADRADTHTNIDEEQEIQNMICVAREEELIETNPDANEHCMCKAWGDPHIDMFDGNQRCNQQSTCMHTLSKVKIPNHECYYNIEIKNMRIKPTDWFSYVEKVIIEFFATPDATEITQVTFDRTGNWKLDGQRQTTARQGANKAWEVVSHPKQAKGFIFRRDSPTKPQCFLEVNFDGKNTAIVKIRKGLGQDIYGMCGNCDGVENDFVLASGEVPTDANGQPCSQSSQQRYRPTVCDSKIGQSYLVDTPGSAFDTECALPAKSIQCSDEDRATAMSDDFCGYVKKADGPFAECLNVVDSTKVESIYLSCLEDVCMEKNAEAACNAMGALHELCAEKGVYPEWRTREFCYMECGQGSTYSPKCPTNQPTCTSGKVQQMCAVAFSEGCICDAGLVRENGICVPRSECDGRCLYNGLVEMKNGEKRMFGGCSKFYVCRDGEIKTEETTLCKDVNAECVVTQNVASCLCNEGYTRPSALSKCQKVTNEAEKDPDDDDARKLNRKIKEQRRKNKGEREKKRKRRRNCRRPFGKRQRGGGRNPVAAGTETCSESSVECMCTARGDPHYTTFDGDRIDYQGDCSYTLSKTKDPNHACAYHVMVKNWKSTSKDTVATTKQVTIVWKGGNHRAFFGQGLKLKLDGEEVPAPVNPKDENWSIERSSAGLVFKMNDTVNNCWVQVIFNGKHEAKVMVPKTMGPVVEGICGTCNDQSDDFYTKDGEDVGSYSKSERDFMIGESWSIPDIESSAEHCSKTSVEPLCTPDWDQRSSSVEFCGAITSTDTENVFSQCIAGDLISPEELENLFVDCKQDVCANSEEPTLDDIFCSHMESLASLCAAQGLLVDWRGSYPECSMTCDAVNNEVYQYDAPGCPAVCGTPEPEVCDLPDAEGCVCKEGYVRSGDRCVHEATECGCTEENGQYYQLGDTWRYKDCNTLKSCEPGTDGKSVIVSEEDPACTGQHQTCVISEDFAVSCGCAFGYKPENDACVELVECVENEIYSPTAPLLHLQNSCSNTNSVSDTTERAPGCVCQAGFMRKHAGGPCDNADTACACTDLTGKHRQLEEEWYNTDCTMLHRCTLVDSGQPYKVPGVVNTPASCNNGQCEATLNGDKICSCDLGYQMVGTECVARCESPEYVFEPDGNGDGKCKRLSATCKATQDGFFQTFDRMRFKRQKNCEYLMLQSDPEETCQATVTLKAQDGTDWIEYVKVVYKKLGTNKRAEITFRHGETSRCEVNGQDSGPLGKLSGFGENCRGYLYQHNGKISAKWWDNCDVQVIFNGRNLVFIILNGPGRANPLLGKVKGICGNANDVTEDDLVTKDGLNVHDYHNSARWDMFAHSWRVDESCEACDADAETLRNRDDVCGAYDGNANAPDEVKACLAVVDPELVAELKRSCRHVICSHYNRDRIFMFHTVCNYWIRFRKACEAKNLAMAYKPYGCKFCRCTVSGDPHIRQFDLTVVDYMDKCSYIYAEHHDPSHPCYFRVEVDHDDRGTGRVSWAKSMTIHLFNQANRRVVVLDQGKSVTWDGQPVSLFSSEDIYDGVRMYTWGEYIMVRLDKCGIKVQFNSDRNNGVIEVSPVHGDTVRGVCGNCDGVRNDLVTKDGQDVSAEPIPNNFKLFGRSFLSSSVTDPQSCYTEYAGRECDPQVASALDTTAYCGYFLRTTVGPFQACAQAMVQMELGSMRNDCHFDVCMTKGSEQTVCSSLQGLADVCKELGFDVTWRTDTFCPVDCGSNAEYYEVASNCEETCAGTSADCVDTDPSPGCRCKSGYVRSENGCVARENCGCMHEGRYFPLYMKWMNNACDTSYQCTQGPSVTTAAGVCPQGTTCVDMGGYSVCDEPAV